MQFAGRFAVTEDAGTVKQISKLLDATLSEEATFASIPSM